MTAILDFDDLWADRDTVPLTMRAFGATHNLPPERPAGLTLTIARMKDERGPEAALSSLELEAAARYIFGPERLERFMERGLSEPALVDMVLGVLAEYHRREHEQAAATPAPTDKVDEA